MKTIIHTVLLGSILAIAPAARAQDASQSPPAASETPDTPETPVNGEAGTPSFDAAASDMNRRLEQALEDLARLREQIAAETIPLSRQLSDLESALIDTRLEYQQTSRLLDSRTLDVSNLGTEIKARKEEASYLADLLSEYIRNFQSRLHIAELQRYEEALETANLAAENSGLSDQERFAAQAAIVGASIDRLEQSLGGVQFAGAAIDPNGTVAQGTFTLIGPVALFKSADGTQIGTAEQRLGSLQPTIVPYHLPEDIAAAADMIARGEGVFPLDPTLGNAHVIAATEETLLEHIQKGGEVMYPIFALAGAALLVAIYKWLALLFVRKPSRRRIKALLDAVARNDRNAAEQIAGRMRGPAGRMLRTGVEHIEEPPDLIEEVMYEHMLSSRLKLQRFLPFIAISAAAAPLLGLLGTVTGIITTFKLITVFGTGDVKTLSGGISEALITTEFGLIVAIPSLLIHALLSRKARGIVDSMEKVGIAFVNQVSKAHHGRSAELVPAETAPVPTGAQGGAGPGNAQTHEEEAHEHPSEPRIEPTSQQIREVLADLLAPLVRDGFDKRTDAAEVQREDDDEDADDEPVITVTNRQTVGATGNG